LIQLSYSKISTFEQCPLKFKFQYIEKLPAKTTPHLLLGQTVHSAIDKFLKKPQDSRNLDLLYALFRSDWKESRNIYRAQKALDMDLNTEKQFGKRGLEMLNNFYESNFNSTPHASEQFVKAIVNEEIVFVGRIDRIELFGNGFRVVDYKTGKFSPMFIDFLQLNTYAWVMNKFGMKTFSSVFYYLEEDKTVEREFDDEVLKNTEEELLKKMNYMLEYFKTGEFLPKPSKLCGWCDYTDICPEGRQYVSLLKGQV